MTNAHVSLQVTDSPYVVASMGIMTRMGTPVLNKLADGEEFVRCQHSLGRPLPLKSTYFKTHKHILSLVFAKILSLNSPSSFSPQLL